MGLEQSLCGFPSRVSCKKYHVMCPALFTRRNVTGSAHLCLADAESRPREVLGEQAVFTVTLRVHFGLDASAPLGCQHQFAPERASSPAGCAAWHLGGQRGIEGSCSVSAPSQAFTCTPAGRLRGPAPGTCGMMSANALLLGSRLPSRNCVFTSCVLRQGNKPEFTQSPLPPTPLSQGPAP